MRNPKIMLVLLSDAAEDSAGKVEVDRWHSKNEKECHQVSLLYEAGVLGSSGMDDVHRITDLGYCLHHFVSRSPLNRDDFLQYVNEGYNIRRYAKMVADLGCKYWRENDGNGRFTQDNFGADDRSTWTA